MQSVKVKRFDLLSKVAANREKHLREYQEAVAGYKEAALEEVERAMNVLRRQIEGLQTGEVIPLAHVYFNLAVPQSHQDDYDQAIEMLKMSVEEEIQVSHDEFRQYVMDVWNWSQATKQVFSMYNDRLKG